jgi:HIV Tat-specific factor 1
MDNNDIDFLNIDWYYIDTMKQQPNGPISIRDIDVLMRTNAINSNTYVWKDGMSEWRKIYELEELKDIASTTHTEIQESIIKTKIQNSFTLAGQKIENNTVDNFYFGSDGLWHVYNPTTKTWSMQIDKPKKQDNQDKLVNNKTFNLEDIIENNKVSTINTEEKSNENTKSDKIIEKLITPHSSPLENEVDLNKTPAEEENLLKRKRADSTELSKSVVNHSVEILNEQGINKIDKNKKKTKKKKEKKKQQWYNSKVNSNIYINKLPIDITEQEINIYFSRCGFIRKDERTGDFKIKIYKDGQGKNKGDAIVSFLREESVQIAIDLLNETEIRPGHKISVEKAQFEQKGNYKPRISYTLDDIQRYKIKTDVDRLLGWNDEDNEKGLKIVILKNLFKPEELFEDEGLKQDLELDILEECEANFGQVDKFMIFEENPFGIVKIKFKTPLGAERCIEALNGRYYNAKLIEAFYWDGKTDYTKVTESAISLERRVDEFGNWLEKQ